MSEEQKPKGEEHGLTTVTVLSGCVDGITVLKTEAERLEVCRCLVTIILQGYFCDDRQKLIPVLSKKDAGQFELIKENIHKLRESAKTTIIH